MASEMPPMVQIGSAYGGRGPGVLAVSWAGLIFTSILIAGRLHLRLKRTQESQNDFAMWLALVAWVTAIVATCLVTVSVSHGLGNHTMNLSFPNIVMATKYEWVSISMAALSSGVSKASVAVFLLNMQGKSTTHKRGAWLLYFIAISNVLINIATMFIIIYQCNPVEATWNFIAPGNCYVREKVFGPVGLIQASWNAVSDLILALYPVFIVYQLQISIRLKLFLCVIMGLGVVASAFSFVKLDLLSQLVKHAPEDPMWQLAILTIWGQVELWIVLIALSIPPIWPLVKPFLADVASRVGTGRRTARTGASDDKGDWLPMKDGSIPAGMSKPYSAGGTNKSWNGKYTKDGYGGIPVRTDVTVTSSFREDAHLEPYTEYRPAEYHRDMV